MSPRVRSLAIPLQSFFLLLVVSFPACTKPNPAYCDQSRPCTDPAASYCDETAQCQSLRNTCIAPQLCKPECSGIAVGACINDDGCCADGCFFAMDNNCLCGDGNVATGTNPELCDIAINAPNAGACPTAATCNDNNACTVDTITGEGTCQAKCTRTTITQAGPDDGCCPPGANANNDPDCAAMCGNGVVESGENCEPSITSGQGMCMTPTSCQEDNNACTTILLGQTSACNVTCTRTPGCFGGDGCCPAYCMGTDPDCPCGNGMIDGGEKCDLGIPGSCPTSCPGPTAPCSFQMLMGQQCQAECVTVPICVNNDGCCPQPPLFCQPGMDNDC